MLKRLVRQYKVPKVGGFKEVLAQAAFWITIINFILIAVTAYHTTLRDYITPHIPWFDLPVFFLSLGTLVLIIMVIEYKFVIPSLYIFRSKQMFEHESQVTRKLDEVLDKLNRLEGKNESRSDSPHQDAK